MLDAVRGSAQMESLGANRFGQFTVDIAPRANLGRRPVGEPAVVHSKAVVMLKNANNILRASFFEEARPSGGIEALGAEHGDEILVTEFCKRAIDGEMVLVFV